MSKKKAKKGAKTAVKKSAKKAVKKAVTKKPARAAAGRAPARLMSQAQALPSRRTAAATIFVYQVDGKTRVRTSPQLLSAGPGSIEWTVVNLGSDAPVDVDIVWQKDSPWGGSQPIRILNGNYRRTLDDAKDGKYKYNVMCDGFCEDPEIEIPGN
jgi:hypothetical protein